LLSPISLQLMQVPRSKGGAGVALYTDRLPWIYEASEGEARFKRGQRVSKPVVQKTAGVRWATGLAAAITQESARAAKLLAFQSSEYACTWLYPGVALSEPSKDEDFSAAFRRLLMAPLLGFASMTQCQTCRCVLFFSPEELQEHMATCARSGFNRSSVHAGTKATIDDNCSSLHIRTTGVEPRYRMVVCPCRAQPFTLDEYRAHEDACIDGHVRGGKQKDIGPDGTILLDNGVDNKSIVYDTTQPNLMNFSYINRNPEQVALEIRRKKTALYKDAAKDLGDEFRVLIFPLHGHCDKETIQVVHRLVQAQPAGGHKTTRDVMGSIRRQVELDYGKAQSRAERGYGVSERGYFERKTLHTTHVAVEDWAEDGDTPAERPPARATAAAATPIVAAKGRGSLLSALATPWRAATRALGAGPPTSPPPRQSPSHAVDTPTCTSAATPVEQELFQSPAPSPAVGTGNAHVDLRDSPSPGQRAAQSVTPTRAGEERADTPLTTRSRVEDLLGCVIFGFMVTFWHAAVLKDEAPLFKVVWGILGFFAAREAPLLFRGLASAACGREYGNARLLTIAMLVVCVGMWEYLGLLTAAACVALLAATGAFVAAAWKSPAVMVKAVGCLCPVVVAALNAYARMNTSTLGTLAALTGSGSVAGGDALSRLAAFTLGAGALAGKAVAFVIPHLPSLATPQLSGILGGSSMLVSLALWFYPLSWGHDPPDGGLADAPSQPLALPLPSPPIDDPGHLPGWRTITSLLSAHSDRAEAATPNHMAVTHTTTHTPTSWNWASYSPHAEWIGLATEWLGLAGAPPQTSPPTAE
jgi:hypothetical protein